MITSDLPTIRNRLDTPHAAVVHRARPGGQISLAETYTSSFVLRDTWDNVHRELRLELKAGVALPIQDVAEAFLDALKAEQLEASGAEGGSYAGGLGLPDACGRERGCLSCREKLGYGSVSGVRKHVGFGLCKDAD